MRTIINLDEVKDHADQISRIEFALDSMEVNPSVYIETPSMDIHDIIEVTEMYVWGIEQPGIIINPEEPDAWAINNIQYQKLESELSMLNQHGYPEYETT